jgi:hypothetical protein
VIGKRAFGWARVHSSDSQGAKMTGALGETWYTLASPETGHTAWDNVLNFDRLPVAPLTGIFVAQTQSLRTWDPACEGRL